MVKAPLEIRTLQLQEMESLLERARARLDANDCQLLQSLIQSVQQLWQLVEQQGMSMGRLRQLLFGLHTEKTDRVLPPQSGDLNAAASNQPEEPIGGRQRRRGHGRHGASDYSGAQKIKVAHPKLRAGDACPDCAQGKLYGLTQPSPILRIVAQPIFPASLYQLEKLRCNLCGQLFTAPPPPEAGTQKYDESVGSMLALLRYGSGLPFARIEKLQAGFGVPLPTTTQWELVESAAQAAEPVFRELQRQAAQQPVLYNDDTSMTVLSLRQARRRTLLNVSKATPEQQANERTGIFTSGILAEGQDHPIALFFTGGQHAGENLNQLLQHRDAHLPPPIQMCDALSRNEPKAFQVLLANCIAHGRRHFVEVAPNFPTECRHVLEKLRDVYRHDAYCKEHDLSPQARLAFHQANSGPVMDQLRDWMSQQLDQKQVEPNSGLGKAIRYMLNHWEALTLFLRQPGAPLDNNICERALKLAILHRKNSMFFKTQHGAQVGDLFMSLIHSCRLNGVAPFDYLTSLQRNSPRVKEHPQHWLPWTYQKTLQGIDTS